MCLDMFLRNTYIDSAVSPGVNDLQIRLRRITLSYHLSIEDTAKKRAELQPVQIGTCVPVRLRRITTYRGENELIQTDDQYNRDSDPFTDTYFDICQFSGGERMYLIPQAGSHTGSALRLCPISAKLFSYTH